MLTRSDFQPAFWLRNAHAQTVFASKLRPCPPLEVQCERLELEDGDFLDLSWLPERGLADDAPIVIVLHGLNGSLESKYARGCCARPMPTARAACCCIFAARSSPTAWHAAIIPARPRISPP